jgi:glycosyltransferase involved in cell wall biosynthesis
MRIIVFTSDENNGGILQFTLQMYQTSLDLGYESFLFVPTNNKALIPKKYQDNTVRFAKSKDPFGLSNKIGKTVERIEELNPDIFLSCDEAIFSIQVLNRLQGNIKRVFTIHDVSWHPSDVNIRRYLVYFLSIFYRREGLKKTSNLFLLSKNSLNIFSKKYKRYVNKTILFRLGAHPPKNKSKKEPEELKQKGIQNNYFLYFGRIEKYKGVDRLVNAYTSLKLTTPLVIAGKGDLDEETKKKIKQNVNIINLNRFIEDDEMNWLFTTCKCVVLPYIQASQSGVIPMAYHFGKQVIASNIDGIKENVDNDTGYLFDSEDDLKKELEIWDGKKYESIHQECIQYEHKYLNWKMNFNKAIGKIYE